jgi:hypothetical protein
MTDSAVCIYLFNSMFFALKAMTLTNAFLYKQRGIIIIKIKKMNKIKHGTILLLTFLSTVANAQDMVSSSGQVESPRFALSINGGLTFSYTDVKPQKTGLIVGVGGAFFATPYLHVNLDVQKGWLKGGDKINTSGIMGSDNSFYSGTVTARFLPLCLIKYNHNAAVQFFSGVYVGAGVGFISNTVKSNTIISPDFGSLGNYSGFNFMVPIEAGINIPLAQMMHSRVLLNLNYRANLCMSDKIDGYVPIVEANKKNDAFNTLTAGIVYNF